VELREYSTYEENPDIRIHAVTGSAYLWLYTIHEWTITVNKECLLGVSILSAESAGNGQ